VKTTIPVLLEIKNFKHHFTTTFRYLKFEFKNPDFPVHAQNEFHFYIILINLLVLCINKFKDMKTVFS
jgi:hypothetical protein